MESRIAARLDDETYRRLTRVRDRYDMNESQVVRLCIRHGLDEIESNGLDGLVDQLNEEGVSAEN